MSVGGDQRKGRVSAAGCVPPAPHRPIYGAEQILYMYTVHVQHYSSSYLKNSQNENEKNLRNEKKKKTCTILYV